MSEREYPYLAKNTVGDKTYVVFFSAEKLRNSCNE